MTSQAEINQAVQIGRNNGHVNENGLSHQDRNDLVNARNAGLASVPKR